MSNANANAKQTDARNALRSQLLGNKHKANSREIQLFGQTIELRQPSFGDIMDAREMDNAKTRVAHMIINYSYVPDTNERLFEDSDVDTILAWPFGNDLLEIQSAIAELSGIDIGEAEEAEEGLRTDPLDAP